MSQVVELTDENFQAEVLESKQLVLVDCWATWCGPCKAIGPLVEQLAEDRSDVLKVGKLDVDAHQQIAARYNVRSIPTLMLFRGGDLLDTRIGAMPKGELEQFVASQP